MIVAFWFLLAAPLLVVLPYGDDLLRGRLSVTQFAAALVPFFFALWLVTLTVSVLAKWIIIGRYRPGAYPLWGNYYLRWWFVSKLQGMSGAGLLTGTPLISIYFRLMGAKVGRHCALETAQCSIWDSGVDRRRHEHWSGYATARVQDRERIPDRR